MNSPSTMTIQDGNASLDESSSWTDNHTNPKFFVLIAIRSLAFSICLRSRGGYTAWICRYW